MSGTYQGWLGYGWGLEGISVIERMRPKFGVPSFDDTKVADEQDIYVLNGQPLFKCTDTRIVNGGSCLAGGNYVSEVENYLKISVSSTGRTWKITGRDGTVTTLASVGDIAPPATAPAAGTDAYDLAYKARWLVTSVKDTNGNEVTYGYSCFTLPVCYIDKITYNNRTVTFYYATRPDYLLMANGHSISTITRRIDTIIVKTGSAVTSGYRLRYDLAPGSDASLLTSVRPYGNDLALDTADKIISGTGLPTTTFAYNGGGSFASAVNVDNLKKAPDSLAWGDFPGNEGVPAFIPSTLLSVLDVNSDGISEVLYHFPKSLTEKELSEISQL